MHNKNFILNVPLIRSWLKREGLKQYYVAKKIGMTAPRFSSMLKTGRLPVGYLTVRRLCQVTGFRRTSLIVEVKRD